MFVPIWPPSPVANILTVCARFSSSAWVVLPSGGEPMGRNAIHPLKQGMAPMVGGFLPQNRMLA